MFDVKFYEGNNITHFELDVFEINKSMLNACFKNVDKLRFMKNGEVVEIDSVGDLFNLQAGVFEYEVVCQERVIQENEVVRLIVEYFYCRYQYKEICKLLRKDHGIQISLTSLKRILRILGLKRKNIAESPIEDIIEAIIIELKGPGKKIGYKFMWQRLRRNYRLNVKQSTVLKLMRIIDPEGLEERSRYRLKRRTYVVPGPNYLWHVDGFDKLKRFGFAISGCVDGFSRKVIWLRVATTNNKPEVIAYYYLQALKAQKCVPSLMRSDKGTENCLIQLLQIALRSGHDDEDANENCFIKGKSTANERIEKYWKQLRNHTAGFYIELFKDMEQKRELDPSNPLHIAILRYCFGTLLQSHLDNSTKEWNEHRIRQQHNLRVPCGIPNILYNCPEQYDGRDCGHTVDLHGVDVLIDSETIKPKLYDQEIEDLIQSVWPGTLLPATVEQAHALFLKVTEAFDEV